MAKPSLPQGTRDFGPDVVRKRNYILHTIQHVFELCGFQPLETPAMENLETLIGKYGDEGDKLIFRVLESGNIINEDFIEEYSIAFREIAEYYKNNHQYLSYLKENYPDFAKAENPFGNNLWNLNPEVLADLFNESLKNKGIGTKYLSNIKNELSGKALKYDLTIPFARYVAMNHNKLSFPFKRYQIQPVWRADRPQKGRYREFYQCDADVVGSNALLNEVELATIYATVFEKLGIPVEIKMNNRKILSALAEICGGADKMMDITIAIDKLDKIGLEKVKEELSQKGLTSEQITIIEKYLGITGNNDEKIAEVKKLLISNEKGVKGIEEIEYILSYSLLTTHYSPLSIDFTLARGLNYYTGIIFEVKAKNVQMGSIGGGGRYDDLTGLFGVPNIPGVGISFGVDRIYDVMEELKLFPEDVNVGTQVLFFNLGDAESKKAFELMQQLRNNNTRCELYPENTKMEKQFKYADKKNITFAVIIGTRELENNECTLKNLKTGEQQTISPEKLLNLNF